MIGIERGRAVAADDWAEDHHDVELMDGCLKTGTRYDETTAWSHHAENLAA